MDLEKLKNDALGEVQAVAMARPVDCLEVVAGKLELKSELPPACAAGIASIERTAQGVKLRFHDKLKALQILLTFTTGTTTGEDNNLLEAIQQATANDIDLEGIEELENGILIE